MKPVRSQLKSLSTSCVRSSLLGISLPTLLSYSPWESVPVNHVARRMLFLGVKGVSMASHKYKIGQDVRLRANRMSSLVGSPVCKIMRQLPTMLAFGFIALIILGV